MRGQDGTGANLSEGTPELSLDCPLATSAFLRAAVGMAGALDRWHQRSGPHGALSLAAFTATGCDSTPYELAGGGPGPAGPPYAAPEQTGRLERGIDERTDLYALGVLYYRLLSGRWPFRADGPADWWRCHLAEPPLPLADLVPGLPRSLGEIVHLLLAKSPDDRYQTATGVATDLERVADAVRAGTGDTPVLLRMRDVGDRLILSGRVYGRERQLARLQTGYDRVAQGGPAELIAVTADTGLGKWATVADFADSVVTAGGTTVRAGCVRDDDVPYAAVTRLLADLAAQLADAPADRKARISNAVGACGSTLIELVPALRAVLGDRPPAPDGPAGAARNRVRLATRRLLGAVADPGRPLVVALANVQWADRPTVDLLRYVLATPDAPSVLVVVTYRTGDVGTRHPFHALLGDPRVPSSAVTLRPLPDSALADLLADTLHSGMRDSSRLSRTVAARTGSNPLLVGHFLHELADRELIAYGTEAATWHWQQRRIEEQPEVAALATLVRAKLDRFSPGTRDLLDLAAVLGARFDASTLAAAVTHRRRPGKAARSRSNAGPEALPAARPGGRTGGHTRARAGGPAASAAEISGQLRPAVQAELISAGPVPGEYRWRHEQLRQAVVGAGGAERLRELHLAAGLAMRGDSDRLFAAVGHLNKSIELVGRGDEQRRLAELNLAAGVRAGRIGAVTAAREYLAMALDLLEPGSWQRSPELALHLHLASAQAELAADSPDRAELLVGLARQHVTTDTDRARLLRVHAAVQKARGDRPGALRLGYEALRLLDLPVPVDPARWEAAATAATDRLCDKLGQPELDRLVDGPDCTDPRVELAADLIADLTYPTWPDRSGRDVLTVAGVELALAEGPTPATGFTLIRMAAVLSRSGHNAVARRCARAGMRLLDRPGARYRAVSRSTAALIGPQWLDEPATMTRELYAAYRAAVDEGEIRAAHRIGAVYAVHLYAVGTPLDQVAAEIDARWRFARRHGPDDVAGAVIRQLDEAVSRLRALPCDAPPPDDAECAASAKLLGGELGYYSIVGVTPMLTVTHLLGEYPEAAALGDVAGLAAGEAPHTFLTAETWFSRALALTARHDVAGRDVDATLDGLQAELDRPATEGPALFRARALLLAAERARVRGENARSRYDRAITSARECGFLPLEGLAAELGGRYALAGDERGDAVAYLRRARSCYQRWGAEAKLDQIDELMATATLPADGARALDQLDLLTVVRGFQAISGELRRDRLVGVLLDLFVQHSQADRGCLLLADGAGLRPAAVAEVDGDHIRVGDGSGRDLSELVPAGLVEHAGRQRIVLAGSADDLGPLAADPYLATHRPRSVLCAPIVRRDTLLAVLYLEHRRLASAFSAPYLDLLRVLRTQAAVALENATVHAQLTEANRILDATFDELPVGLILLGPDFTVRRASPRAVEIMRIPIEPGTSLTALIDVLTPTNAAGEPYRYLPGHAPVATSTRPLNRDVVIVTPDGERVRLATSALPLRGDDGELVGITVLVRPSD